MSIVPKETIEVIAQSVGVTNLSPDAAQALAPDVEYRMREIMQEAIKCMRHSRRTMLTTDDVDTALSIRNVEPVYGFASGDPLQFKRAFGYKDLFYVDDKDIDLKDVIEAPLPKVPLDASVMCHWLAIEGVQPVIPENAQVKVVAAPDVTKIENKDEGLPVDIKLPVRHVLSKELQLYFDKITDLAVNNSGSGLFTKALASLATDPGLHPLVPYFTCFIADEVSRGLGDFRLLFALMRLVRSLMRNHHIQIEPYLHQLMPSILTCIVSKRLGNRFADDHWQLRDFTAKLAASICKSYGQIYNTLQPRLTKTLINTFLDPKRAITQHYGAIQGLAALGPNLVRLYILPNLETYMHLLGPEMLLETQKNEMKRQEAWTVYGALLHAAGQFLHDMLKLFPALGSHPASRVWRKNAKVIELPEKRKMSTEHSEEQQSPAKKMVINDDHMDTSPAQSTSPSNNIQSTTATNSSALVANNANLSTSSLSAPINQPSRNGCTEKDDRDRSIGASSTVLNQVWKEELKSGQVLVSMVDVFGESILPFLPLPELSIFL